MLTIPRKCYYKKIGMFQNKKKELITIDREKQCAIPITKVKDIIHFIKILFYMI